MAQGSLEGKGGGIGFEGIGADIKPLLQQFEAMRKEINQKNVQRRIHRAAGKLFKDEMVRNIQDADDVVRIRRGKAKPLDIPIGTLNRSVRVWLIDKQQNAYWVGPRVGKKMPLRSDGWFANIVEGGDQSFGVGRNKGVFARSIKNKRNAAEQLMIKKYKNAIDKAVKAKAKTTKK